MKDYPTIFPPQLCLFLLCYFIYFSYTVKIEPMSSSTESDDNNIQLNKNIFKPNDVSIAIYNRDLDEIKKLIPLKISATDGIYCELHSIHLTCDKLIESRDYMKKSEKDVENEEFLKILDYLLSTPGYDISKISVHHIGLRIELENCSMVCTLLKRLSSHGVDLNELGVVKHPVVFHAFSQKNHIPVVDFVDCFFECCDLTGTKPKLSTVGIYGRGLIHVMLMLVSPNCSKDILHILQKFEDYHPGISEERTPHNTTPLVTAGEYGMPREVLEYFIEKGCDPSERNNIGATPYESVISRAAFFEHSPLSHCTADQVRKAASILQQYQTVNISGITHFPEKTLVGKWDRIQGSFTENTFKVRFRAIREDVTIKIRRVASHRCFNSDFFEYSDLCREIHQLDSCRCRFILNFLGVVKFDNSTVGLVTELYSKTLYEILSTPQSNSNPHPDLMTVMRQIGGALLYLHVNEKVHGDIAARNVVVTETGLKLSGFGNSTTRGSILPNIAILWSPPELLRLPNYCRLAQPSLDVWSFGVLMYELLSQCRLPYYSPNEGLTTSSDIRNYILQGGVLQRPCHCPPEQWKLVSKCFLSEESRPGVYELLSSLHEYRQDNDIPDSDEQSTATSCNLKYCYETESCAYNYPTTTNTQSSSNSQSRELPQYETSCNSTKYSNDELRESKSKDTSDEAITGLCYSYTTESESDGFTVVRNATSNTYAGPPQLSEQPALRWFSVTDDVDEDLIAYV